MKKYIYNGWIILDKPFGITSAQAVAKVKRLVSFSLREKVAAEGGRMRAVQQADSSSMLHRPHPSPLPKGEGIKIGHAGTLDPLASGVLPLALGEATKTIPYMMDADKEYIFTVTWGQERDTDDCEGKITRTSEKRPKRQEIEAVLPQFTGRILQIPPVFSAIKVEGKRAYDLARAGEAVELKSREVTIFSLLPLGEGGAKRRMRDFPLTDKHSLSHRPHPSMVKKRHLDVVFSTIEPLPEGEGTTEFLCHCSKGTYIRSLARDMGRVLGCFGHISALRRIKVGKFGEAHAISLEMLEKEVYKGGLGFLLATESALDDIPAVSVDETQALRLQRGQNVVLPLNTDSSTVIARCNGKLIAVCEEKDGQLWPKRVFNL